MATQIPAERVRALTDAVVSLVTTVDLGQLLRRVVEAACEATGAAYGALGVIGPHKTLIEFVHHGIDRETVEKIGHLPEGRGVLGTLIRDRTTIRLEDLGQHPDSVGFPPDHPPMQTFLGVPVGSREKAFGNLYLTEKEGGFDEDDVVIVEALSAVAAAAVETSELRRRLESLAVTEDRHRIGRDLHDSIIQDLFGTGLQLQGLTASTSDDQLREGLDQAVDRIDSTIESLREVVADLHSSSKRSSLAEGLRSQVARIAGPYDIPVDVSVSPPDIEMDMGIWENVVAIVGEAVSNALRHAGTETVEVAVERLGGRLLLSVTDQGSGFAEEEVELGMGLANMKERASALGGQLAIRSVPDVGTVVDVVIQVD